MSNNYDLNLSSLFVGREPELKILSELLQNASAGSGSFVVVSGEAGVGKSSLIEYFTRNQNQEKVTLVSESFKAVRVHEPYLPFMKLIDKLNKKEPLPVTTYSQNEHQIFDTANIYSLQSKQNLAQQRLLSSLLESARDKVIIVLLSDTHLAPISSWRFIHYLSASIHESRILLITTIRQDGIEQSQEQIPVYADVLQRMNREGLVHKMELNRFGENEVKNYLHMAFPGRDFSSKFLPYLCEVSGGIPRRVYQILTGLVEQKKIFNQDGVWFDDGHISRDDLLTQLNENHNTNKILSLIENLSDKRKDFLTTIALLNEPFNHRVLSAVSGLPRIKVIKELLYFQELKILLHIDDEHYKFKSITLKAQINSWLAEADKTAQHLQVAKLIESSDSLDESDKIYNLAYHYNHTQNQAAAFKYLKLAGEMAIENFAFMEALDFINRALAFVDDFSGHENDADSAQLRIWAAWLNRILGNLDDSIKNCQAGLALLKNNKNIILKNQLLIQSGSTYFKLNDWEKSIHCFEQCLNHPQTTGQIDQAMAKYGLGNVYFELANYEKASGCFEEALILAEKLQAKQLMANIYNNLGTLENVRSHRLRAIALYSKSIPVFKALGDNYGLARIYHNIGMTHADDNNWQQANSFYGQSLEVADAMGLAPLKSITFLNRALALANLDNLHEAREYNIKAHRLLTSLKDELGVAEYHKVQGVIERKDGNFVLAKEHFGKALEKFKTKKNKLGLAESAFEYAVAEMESNNLQPALDKLNVALTNYRELNLSEKTRMVETKISELQCSAILAFAVTEHAETDK